MIDNVIRFCKTVTIVIIQICLYKDFLFVFIAFIDMRYHAYGFQINHASTSQCVRIDKGCQRVFRCSNIFLRVLMSVLLL